MSRVIREFQLTTMTGTQIVNLPKGFTVRALTSRGDRMSLWVDVDTDAMEYTQVTLEVYWADQPMDTDFCRVFIGTVVLNDEVLPEQVNHVFMRVEE